MAAKREKPTIPNELELLRRVRLRAGLRTGGVRLGIGDDCALLRSGAGEEIAVTTDLSIDGRHFRLDWHPPESIGHRALARGLSDLAAMGARPLAAFLSLGIPRQLIRSKGRQKSWVESFYEGLLNLAAEYKTPLAGGDLAESPVALADIVLVGAVPQGRALLRSGARPGDVLYLTGSLGGASASLVALEAHASRQTLAAGPRKMSKKLATALQPHLYPLPRVVQGLWLQRHGAASSAIDISDGLSSDLTHLCEESGVAAEISQPDLPIAEGATLDQALHGGEDYELLFTARPAVRLPRAIAGVPVTPVGRIVRRRRGTPQILLRSPDGLHPLQPHGWEHFSPK